MNNHHGSWLPSSERRGYQHCSNCSGISPEDLLHHLQHHDCMVELEDMRYMTPFKYFVRCNKLGHPQFFTSHLKEVDVEVLTPLASLLLERRTRGSTPILFEATEEGVTWRHVLEFKGDFAEHFEEE